MLTAIKQLLFLRGHRLFLRPYELNIVGVRSKIRKANSFDDTIHVFYTDENGNWKIHSYTATTDPGTHWLQEPLNNNGAAILKTGQYIDSYQLGLHRGKYRALIQAKPVTVFRDNNTDSTIDLNPQHTETGMFGINIHRAAIQGTTSRVDAYSAGCQVFANAADFTVFINLCQIHKERYGNHFTYTLLDAVFQQQQAAA